MKYAASHLKTFFTAASSDMPNIIAYPHNVKASKNVLWRADFTHEGVIRSCTSTFADSFCNRERVTLKSCTCAMLYLDKQAQN